MSSTPIHSLTDIPSRAGERPDTTNTNPHRQLDQHPPVLIIRQLTDYILSIKDLDNGPSQVGIPGTLGFFLNTCTTHHGPSEGFMIDNEFVHIHPLPDGSLHLTLSAEVGRQLIDLKWGEVHPVAGRFGFTKNMYMLYAPRDEAELEIAKAFVNSSLEYAKLNCS